MVDSGLQSIALTRIVPSRWQPREQAFDAERLWELACSIKEHGLINPVVVFPSKRHYELVAGERRTRAMLGLAWAQVDDQVGEKEAVEALAGGGIGALPDEARAALHLAIEGAAERVGEEDVHCEILARVESGETEEELQRLHRLAVVENIERESLTPLEEARALQGLTDEFGWSQRELARHVGKSQSYVAQRLSLLDLTAEAQEAVSTRVLTATHARAIARVPEALQPAVTAHVVQAVQRDDSPATTRQVQNLARQVAAFVDPARWEPNGERVYEPKDRNRLALVRWAVERADLEGCAERLMELRECGYGNENVLGKKPIVVVRSYLGEVVTALIGDGRAHNWWEEFADETGRACDRCVFDDVEVDAGVRLSPYCPRWKDEEGPITTCEGFIGPDDPVVIPISSWQAHNLFEEVGATLEKSGFSYMGSVADYVKAYELAVELERSQRESDEEEREAGYQEEIRAFMDWQATLPGEWLAHFQAQACAKCARHAPVCDPPCFFTQEPLGDSWRKHGPDFAVLVDQEGRLFPRCSEFAYAETPMLNRGGGETFGRMTRVAEWLVEICKASGRGWSNRGLRGVLQWLDYGRPPEKNDWDALERFVKREWEELGGDAAVATLIDVAMHEARAIRAQKGKLKLMHATTGEVEVFAGVAFGTVREGEDPTKEYWSHWPKGWPAPWVEGEKE